MLLYFSHQTNLLKELAVTIKVHLIHHQWRKWSKCFQRMLWTLKHNNTSLLFSIFTISKNWKANSISIIIQPSTMCGLYSFSKETCQYKPQYAFKMSMFMCPAVHINSRSLLRSSSTHEPSDPPLRVNLYFCFKKKKKCIFHSSQSEYEKCI